MFRLEATIYTNGKIIKSCISRQENAPLSRTTKVLDSLKEVCDYLDLAVPIWLDKNISEFQRQSATKFNKDNFVEDIFFDYLKIEVIEE